MNKPQFKVQLAGDVVQRLQAIGERYGMSGNAVVAAAAYELSRVKPENLFHALGRIAEGEGVELVDSPAKSLPAARKRAIPA